MDRTLFQGVVETASRERGCKVLDIDFNDDDNIFEVVLGKDGASVDLSDCEFVHRAVLAAFDRNVEDYSLTVGSQGMDAAEADAMLRDMTENENIQIWKKKK